MAKRDKFIKIMLTEREYKKIERYAGIAFQSKSDFIRSAVRRRIAEINREIYPEIPPASDRLPNLRKLVLSDLEDALNEVQEGAFLKEPDENELKMREDEKRKRIEELEKIRSEMENME
jgi:hypothetical protein